MNNTIKFSVLIVEDELINAKYMQKTIETLGHTVIDIVNNSDDAIKSVLNNTIDLIFMDINILGLQDGIKCARLINEENNIPIIYITAYQDAQTIDEASQTNIYGFVTKPFDSKNIEIALSVAKARILKEKHCKEIKNRKIILGNNIIFDTETKILTISNKYIKLTKKETLFLDVLANNFNQLVSIDTINSILFPNGISSASSIRDMVFRLRKKVSLIKIENIHGVGYILTKE